MIGYGNSMFLATHGILARSGGGIDPDAQAFITAASITDPTQQSAINQLVVDLKGYNIWTKMKAIYPIVGGVASSHAVNLKTPGTFNLTFASGWTHSSTGMTPVNSYANTGLTPSTSLVLNSTHLSYYSRTNTSYTNALIGVADAAYANGLYLIPKNSPDNEYTRINQSSAATLPGHLLTYGLFLGNRVTSTQAKSYRNGSVVNFINVNSSGLANTSIYLGAANFTPIQYTTCQTAFASIGDGLTDTEAANFYTAVQAFQTTLGRSIGTQTVSDADAQAFVTNAGIVDQVEANAINNLVIGLKADGLWTKMKAVYPFVGGTATTNKYNLKNPLDTDAAFRLVFNGGWTFSSTGATPNGTNGYADTKLSPNTVMNFNSQHYCIYKTSVQNATACEFGVIVSPPTNFNGINCFLRDGYGSINDGLSVQFASTTTAGAYILNRNNTNDKKLFRNGSLFDTKTAVSSNNTLTNVFLGARNDNGTISWYANTQTRFFSIGDGLTDAEALNLNTRVTTFQTALNRNV